MAMDMPESCFGCNFLYCDGDTNLIVVRRERKRDQLIQRHIRSRIGARFGNCRREWRFVVHIMQRIMQKVGRCRHTRLVGTIAWMRF